MMLDKYRTRVGKIERDVVLAVCKQLRIKQCRKGKDALFRVLDLNGYDQADLVLCLLRINSPKAIRHAEKLIGHRIERCPSVYKWKPLPVNVPDRAGDERRVTRVVQQPRLKSGRLSWLRHYHLFKVGLSVAQLVRRGVTSGDLKLVTRRGWVELSPS